ncbi:hypothetical protein ACFE04_029448 [Oxalis oulophora]
MRKSGSGDRSGLHNHYPNPNSSSKRKGQKKMKKWIKIAAHFKALSFLMFLRVGSSIKITKKIKYGRAFFYWRAYSCWRTHRRHIGKRNIIAERTLIGERTLVGELIDAILASVILWPNVLLLESVLYLESALKPYWRAYSPHFLSIVILIFKRYANISSFNQTLFRYERSFRLASET